MNYWETECFDIEEQNNDFQSLKLCTLIFNYNFKPEIRDILIIFNKKINFLY